MLRDECCVGYWKAGCDPVGLAGEIMYVLENRPVQRLTGEIDIDEVVARFQKEVTQA